MRPSIIFGIAAGLMAGGWFAIDALTDSTAQMRDAPSAADGSLPDPTSTTARAQPSAGYEQTSDGFAYTTESGGELAVPEISGLKPVLEGGEIHYEALPGNPYGLLAGANAGSHKPLVSVEVDLAHLEQTGGLVLHPDVALNILTDHLAGIPGPKDRWLIPLPVDIQEVRTEVEVSFFERTAGPDVFSYVRIALRAGATAPITNVLPKAESFSVDADIWGGVGYADALLSVPPYYEHMVPGEEMRYLFVLGVKGVVPGTVVRNARFGDVVSTTSSSTIDVSYGLQGNPPKITPDKILSIASIPVFVASR